MNALPILLLGGAALYVMAGKKASPALQADDEPAITKDDIPPNVYIAQSIESARALLPQVEIWRKDDTRGVGITFKGHLKSYLKAIIPVAEQNSDLVFLFIAHGIVFPDGVWRVENYSCKPGDIGTIMGDSKRYYKCWKTLPSTAKIREYAEKAVESERY